jgi:hypothetical protein
VTPVSLSHSPARTFGRGLLVVAVSVLLLTPNAEASGTDVWRECVQTGAVTTNHSQADFKDALTNPPADGAEYSPCLDAIRAAQNAKGLGSSSSGGGSGSGGGTSGTTSGGSTGTPSAAPSSGPAVQPEALSSAIKDTGIDPSAPIGADAPAPAPVLVAGKSISLEDGRMPSLASAFSLPLPVAASAVIVMLAAALPVVRFVAARFSADTTTAPTSPPAP